MGKIFIKGLEVKACHGVLGFEKTQKQPFVFDAEITCGMYSAALSDSIENTINYADVCALIKEIAEGNCFNLIEKLAAECVFKILESFPSAMSACVTVHKPQAPVGCDFSDIGVSFSAERQTAYLSLGSSIGDRKGYLDSAIKKLSLTRGVKVEKVSNYIQTEPYGGVARNTFLNCAVSVSTFLGPFALLEEIHRIESECGRVRAARWDDRTLDIDIIFFGDMRICTPELTVPHRDYKNRDFVKNPLKEIAPHLF